MAAIDTRSAAFTPHEAESVEDYIWQIDAEDTPFYASIGKQSAGAMKEEWLYRAYRAAKHNAAFEAGDAGTPAANLGTRLANYIQTFSDAVQVSTASEAVKKYGLASVLTDQIDEQMAGQRRDIEYAMVGKVLDTVGATNELAVAPADPDDPLDATARAGYETSGSIAALMLSVHGMINSDNRLDGSSGTFNETFVLNMAAAIYAGVRKNMPRILMVKPADQLIVADFAGKTVDITNVLGTENVGGAATRARQVTGTTVTNVVSLYVTPYGSLSVVPNTHILESTALVYDPEMIDCLTLEPMQWDDVAIATAKAREVEIFSRLTLAVRNNLSLATVEDIL